MTRRRALAAVTGAGTLLRPSTFGIVVCTWPEHNRVSRLQAARFKVFQVPAAAVAPTVMTPVSARPDRHVGPYHSLRPQAPASRSLNRGAARAWSRPPICAYSACAYLWSYVIYRTTVGDVGVADVQSFPYFSVARTLPAFIRALGKSTPTPGDLDKWFASAVGLTPSVIRNERSVFRRFGWVTESDTLTDQAMALRGDQASQVAARVLAEHYQPFMLVLDRGDEDPEGSLESYLLTNTSLGTIARQRVIRTFRQLQELAQTGRISGGELERPTRHSRRRANNVGTTGSPGPGLRSTSSSSMGERNASGEVVFPLESGSVTIRMPKSLTPDDIKTLHALIDLLAGRSRSNL